ncbi:MAG TPA: PHB depolymerase family esterase [Ktedonobacterales bacterium]
MRTQPRQTQHIPLSRRLLTLALVCAIAFSAALTLRGASTIHAAAGTWQQFTYSGSAGSRPYFVYTPAGYTSGAAIPLIVMLHGCTQTPADFAAGTQMDALADANDFLVVYPQQTSSYNQTECWNWFLPADQSRGSGEPAIIAGIVQTVEASSAWTIDKSHVYVAGMSAGAAMAVIMGATYPDIFAAIGVHSGLEYQAATSQTAATNALSQGGPNPTQQGQAAYNAMGSYARVVPTIVFQGTSDYTVYPLNGDQVVQQWMQTDHLASNNTYNASFNSPASSTNGQVSGGHAYTTQKWNDSNGAEVQEYWKISGMGHAWSGGSTNGSFTDPQGPSASQAMYTFFMAHAFGPTVTASPAGGAYNGSVQVTLTATPSNATIRYTTDGSTPTTSSATYTSALTFSQTTTLKYFGVDANSQASAVQTQVYTIAAIQVTATPPGGSYTGPQSVTLSLNMPGAIYYTTDGSTPTTSSAQYTGPITISVTTTLSYLGVDQVGHSGPVQTQTYTITSPPPVHTLTLNSLPTEDGYAYQHATDGQPNSTNQYLEVGSSSLNHGEISVVSFDTTSLPAGATIVSATLTLTRYDAFPFNDDLGPLTADIAPASGFNGSYALEQADYGAAAAQVNIGNFNALPTAQNQAITDAVAQSAIQYINRSGHTQFRIHFQKPTNNDYMLDVLHFYSGDAGGSYVPTLTIQYQ